MGERLEREREGAGLGDRVSLWVRDRERGRESAKGYRAEREEEGEAPPTVETTERRRTLPSFALSFTIRERREKVTGGKGCF